MANEQRWGLLAIQGLPDKMWLEVKRWIWAYSDHRMREEHTMSLPSNRENVAREIKQRAR
jgi:hypothetical protein